MRRRGEDGQLLVLTAFLGVVLILLVAVVVDVSAAFLARRNLSSQADGAALAAAQSLDLDAYYAGEGGDLLPLGDVDEAVRDYVAANFPGTTVEDVDLVDGGTAVSVTLSTHLDLPLSPPGFEGGIDVTAGATARLPLR
ncbi:MAG TPA: pilus assembly protein TadG-related protein [Frankiaceae bacterium]|nr:pilus assembly protein TadG-related protein [Frankiaceae bacterium]